MIRINLLGRPRPRVKRRVAIAGTLQLVLALSAVLLAVVWLGVHHYLISREVAELEQKIGELNRELLPMAETQKQIEQFKQTLGDLETRLNVIEELRRDQQGPVQLLDAIGAVTNRTETLWLTRFDQKGDKITLEGVAGSVNAVANFMTNLKASGLFTNIEIKEAVQSTQNPGIENYTFSLTCDFVLPKPTQTAPAPAAVGR